MLKLAGLLATLFFAPSPLLAQALLADAELLHIPPAVKTLEGMKECGPYILVLGEPGAWAITVVVPSPTPEARLMAPIIPLEIVTVIVEERARPRLRWTSGSNVRPILGTATIRMSQKDLKDAHCLPQGRPV